MSKKSYSEGQVLNILRKAPVSIYNKNIKVDGYIGIRVRGKIDFLKNYCGYSVNQN